MKKLHIVIGDSDTRKSSLIRALTGAGQGQSRKDLEVEKANGTISTIHVMQSALQENYKPQLPQQYINFVNQHSTDEFLFSLRVTNVVANGVTYPDAIDYIHQFKQAGFSIASVALLGHSANKLNLSQCGNVVQQPQSHGTPTNKTASQVRQTWGWV
ncbi:hypothetical protein NDJ85_22635 [Vibrio parahaemolyticus]|uniref:hypothetical protein n=1 Tax=Vibrio parahaemolyticus TaxID=670 RepID=UPI002160ADC9|nr:hypothetical protein [Vibrio parahaemolyticus]MCS0080575.1 hypothetical protein [Vibrio parahaemolyticus]HCH5095915.1 hypothetical protein [Vibrio parahaemolyticus]